MSRRVAHVRRAAPREACTVCHLEVSAEDAALGWPLALVSGEIVCQSCYGDEAFCVLCGATLAAGCEGSVCPDCSSATEDCILQAAQ